MQQTITLQSAIEQGRQQLLLPRILFILGVCIFIAPLTLLSLIIINYTDSARPALLIIAAIALVTFFIFVYLPFRYWGKKMIAWKLWAFAYCGDVHQLIKDAKLAGLYFADDTIIGRMLPATDADRASWKVINERFNMPANFVDDPDVPAETVIGISWGHWLFNFVAQSIGIGLATLVLLYAPKDVNVPARILAGGLLLTLLFTMFTFTRDTLIRKRVLIIGNKGIQTTTAGFHSWAEIRNERVEVRAQRKGARSNYLCYDYNGGREDLKLTIQAISRLKLEQLLYVYRNRYKSQVAHVINEFD